MPLPEPLRLMEIAVTMDDHIHPPQTPQTSTVGTSSPTSQAAPSSPVAPVGDTTDIAEFEEDLAPGEGQQVSLIYSGQGLHTGPKLNW